MNPSFAPTAIVINDSQHQTALISMLLGAEGIEVHCASREHELEELVERIPANLFIARWETGGLDGRMMVKLAKRQHPSLREVPALLITDRKLSFSVRMGLTREGFNWVIQSPFTPDNFAPLVRMIMQERVAPTGAGSRHIAAPQGSEIALAAVE